MDVREKLVELLRESPYNIFGNKLGNCYFDSCLELIADHLIANGVTVQECKLGVKRTNADRIRSMNDEELAMCLYQIGYNEGWDEPEYALEWLKQPAEEADND